MDKEVRCSPASDRSADRTFAHCAGGGGLRREHNEKEDRPTELVGIAALHLDGSHRPVAVPVSDAF